MHVYTLVKYDAQSAADALSEVEELMIETTGDDKMFDHLGGCEVISDDLLSTYGVSSFEELESLYIAYEDNQVVYYKEVIRRQVEDSISGIVMPLHEAPMYTNGGGKVKEAACEVLKSGVGKDLPKTLTELFDLVTSSLTKSCEEHWNSLSYAMRSYSSLLEAKDGESFYELAMCKDIHYIDNTRFSESEEGKQSFYILIDRHY